METYKPCKKMWSRRYIWRDFFPNSIPSVFFFRPGYKNSEVFQVLFCLYLAVKISKMSSREFDKFVKCPNINQRI